MKYGFRLMWINKSAIVKLSCTYTGIIFTLWGFVSLFNPLEDLLAEDVTFICKILIGFIILLAVFILSTIISCFIVIGSNQKCIGESSTGNKVYVKYGDMYSPNIIKKGYTGKRAIVISVNRCFDTIVDDKLISSSSQHGQIFNMLYEAGLYTPETLGRKISNLLAGNVNYIELDPRAKSKGNTKRYNAGTIVNLQVDKNLSYYLIGLSYFDQYLNAQTTKEDFVIAVQKLIEFCNRNSQGYPVILPLLGSGLSRTGINLKDILNYLVDAFAINKDIIINDFYIIVWKDNKDKVSIQELRKW